MSFKQSPKGATSNYTLKGTNEIDITTIAAGDSNVKLYAYGADDQVTLQSTNGYATKYSFAMGEGDDRVQADADPNGNRFQFWVRYSSFSGDKGNDILFADDDGLATSLRTASLLNSTLSGGDGFDLLRLYGALNSTVNGDKDNDTIELGYASDIGVDRWNGSFIKGGAGKDVIRVDTRDKNVVDVVIAGDSGNDYIFADNNGFVSGNWSGSVIDGGKGSDDIQFTDATTSLSILGGSGNDLITSGTGNDTVNSGAGNDKVKIQGGTNFVYAEDGNDLVEIYGASTFRGNNTVELGKGNDDAFIENDGNHTVTAASGNDIVEIVGNGSNVVSGDSGADNIEITGNGYNTVSGDAGNDEILITGTGTSDVTGDDGDDVIFLDGNSGTANGGSGNDVIEAVSPGNVLLLGETGNDRITLIDGDDVATGEINAATGADYVDIIEATGTTTVIQLDGDSLKATKFNDTPSGADRNIRGTWSNGDTITFGNGVDVITGFQTEEDVFDTTLGDQGLNADLNGGAGGFYNAFGTSPFDGMVFNKSYYLMGFYTFTGAESATGVNAGFFTIDENGTDSLVYTQGNNGRPTDNANAIVMLDYDASEITFANII